MHALLMRYCHADSRWWSLAIESRIMWCAFFSRQSRDANATHALTNARQSFWIMRVHQSPAFSIIFNNCPCVTRSLTVIAKVWLAYTVRENVMATMEQCSANKRFGWSEHYLFTSGGWQIYILGHYLRISGGCRAVFRGDPSASIVDTGCWIMYIYVELCSIFRCFIYNV